MEMATHSMWRSPPPINTSKPSRLFRPGHSEGQGKPGVLQSMGLQSQTRQSNWTAALMYEDQWNANATHRRLSARGVQNWPQGLGDVNARWEVHVNYGPGRHGWPPPYQPTPRLWAFSTSSLRGDRRTPGNTVLHPSYPQLSDDKWCPKAYSSPRTSASVGLPSQPDTSLNVPLVLFIYCFNKTQSILRLSLKGQQNQTLY